MKYSTLFSSHNSRKRLKKFHKKKSNYLKLGGIIFGLYIFGKIIGIAFIAAGGFLIADKTLNQQSRAPVVNTTPSPTPTLSPIPQSKTLQNDGYHIFQSFNNCGPASLSMALSFYGINESQEVIGQALRPYQVPGGDNDDKSVTLEELAEYSKKHGFIPYHRPMGNPEIVSQFIANDIPVIARTWLAVNEDIGHYRVIKGYDLEAETFLQDDSLQNKNLTYSFDEFNAIWKKFNYEFLVLVPPEKNDLARQILGNHSEKEIAWESAVENSISDLESDASDVDARFNLSVAYHNIGEYEKSVEEFEKIENALSFRTLWYQIEPIQSYFELENYERVFEITNQILNNQNRAFSELYVIRGKIYLERGETELARQEFQNAVFYNVNNQEAKELLESI